MGVNCVYCTWYGGLDGRNLLETCMRKLKNFLNDMDVPYTEEKGRGKPMVRFEHMGTVYAILPSASGKDMYSVLMGYNTKVPSGLVMGFDVMTEWIHRMLYPEDFESELTDPLDMWL